MSEFLREISNIVDGRVIECRKILNYNSRKILHNYLTLPRKHIII